MSKASEIKLGSNRNEGSGDRRRNIKLVQAQGAGRIRREFNIGVSSNVFSETVSPLIANPKTDERADALRSETGEVLGFYTVRSLGIGAAIGGMIVAGILGYAIGRKQR